MADLTALIERLEKADGPSRELDAAIAEAVGEAPGEYWTLITHSEGTFNMDAGRWIKGSVIRTPLNRTGSIDAAVAFAERVLPGWGWVVQNCGRPTGIVVKGDGLLQERAATPAIALCLSVLRALSAQEGSTNA